MARIELAGIPGSPGLALGRARVIYPARFEVESAPLPPGEVASELARFDAALVAARAELGALRQRLRGSLKRELAEFIDAHALILDDREFADGVREGIRRHHLHATAALKAHRDRIAAAFEAIEDPYLRSRREDIDQVVGRVFSALMRGDPAGAEPRKRDAAEIVVCDSAAPAELGHWHEHGALAVVLAGGSTYSHAAILARSLRWPQVCAVAGVLSQVRDGDLLLADGDNGRVIVRPDALDLARLREWQRAEGRLRRARERLRSAESRTRDGVEIALYVNAEQSADLAQARRMGAAGVGLFRTEFLYLGHAEPPGEDVQYRAYREAVLAMAGKPVTLRTLDLGADKAAGTAVDVAPEANPALGLRGLRLSLARPQLFQRQLRAMLRASAYGPVRVLLPMIAGVEEARLARVTFEHCRAMLARDGAPMAERVELGAMIEVPAAALVSAELAREMDFFAVGSNDLVQYVLAADRNNAAVSGLYDPLHPAVLRLLALVAENAAQAGIPVSVCGEIAGDPRFLPVLLALGYTEFSMRPNALLEARAALQTLSRKALRARTRRLLEATSREEIEALFAEPAVARPR